ncbi:MAG TPA: DUF5063 domain-containing protein [Vineibacter sp.]|nr:DUF5063 domain-containing protein [Vineibacter sp.]
MPKIELIDAIRAFLDIVTSDATDANLHGLCEALDRLSLAYFQAPRGALESEHAPAGTIETDLRQTIARRFPTLGLYATTIPVADPDASVMMGHALDDLMDITRDLEEIVWRWESTGPNDAAGHFRFLYEIHWGRHLHDLRRYLHFVVFEK